MRCEERLPPCGDTPLCVLVLLLLERAERDAWADAVNARAQHDRRARP